MTRAGGLGGPFGTDPRGTSPPPSRRVAAPDDDLLIAEEVAVADHAGADAPSPPQTGYKSAMMVTARRSGAASCFVEEIMDLSVGGRISDHLSAWTERARES